MSTPQLHHGEEHHDLAPNLTNVTTIEKKDLDGTITELGVDHSLGHIRDTHGLKGAVTNERELHQGFSIPSLLAVAIMLGGAWANLFNTLAQTILFGGSVLLLYGIWVTGFGAILIYLSLAEFASTWPTSSGPQEWAFQLFPRRFKRFASYGVAWALSCLYLFATMGSTIILARQVISLAAFMHKDYVPTAAHIWAVNMAILVVCGLINLFGVKAMDHLQIFSLVWFICGFFIWLIVPISLSPTKATAAEVFTGELNLSGWSNFVAFMIGLAGIMAGYGIPDAVTHLAEETNRPAVDLPRVMWLSPVISLVSATAMCLTFLFCGVSQITMALNQTGTPYFDFLEATVKNQAGVVCMAVILIYSQFMACFQCQLASSRVIFTFAREGGAFLPKWLGSIQGRLQVPVWAILLNVFFCGALTLILLGSETALNVFLNSTGTFALVVYVPLIVMSLIKGRRFPRGAFFLGKWGWFVNIAAVVYMLFVVIFFHFPYFKRWTPEYFNYNIAIVPGVMLIGLLCWFISGRKHYIIHRNMDDVEGTM